MANDVAFNFSLANPTWDTFIVLLFVFGSFVYGLSLGRDRLITILVSIYMALAVVSNAPYLEKVSAEISIENIFVLKIAAFLLFFLFLFFILSRSALRQTIASADTQGNWWQVILYSFLHIGLLISILLSFLPPSVLTNFSLLTRQIFTSEIGRFLWIICPILAMVLVKGGAATSKSKVEQ